MKRAGKDFLWFCLFLSMFATICSFSSDAISKELEVFGTKGEVLGSLTGKIYYLKNNTSRLPDFSKMKSVGTIYATKLNITPRSFDSGFPGVTNRTEWFGIEYEGTFRVQRAGDYIFRLMSDDGSKLFIDNKLVIDNDFVHGPSSKEQKITLDMKVHNIKIQYFQGPRFEIALVLEYARAGEQFKVFDTAEVGVAPESSKKEYAITAVDVTAALQESQAAAIDADIRKETDRLNLILKRLAEQEKKATALMTELDRLTGDVRTIEKRIFQDIEAIEKLKNPPLPDRYKHIAATKADLEQAIDRVEKQIEEARSADSPAITGLLKTRENYVDQLEKVNASLNAHRKPADPGKTATLQADITRLKGQLDAKNRRIYQISNHLVLNVGADTGELERVLSLARDAQRERVESEDRIMELRSKKQQLLEAAIPFVSGVVVTANGKVVVRATRESSGEYEKRQQQHKKELDQVRANKDKLAAVMKRNEDTKNRAFVKFKESHDKASSALENVRSLLWSTYAREALVESAFYTMDVASAYAKRGLAGALVEAARKGIEAGLSSAVSNAAKIGGLDETSIAAEINKLYNAELSDAWSTPQLQKIAVQRLVKETFTRPVSNYAYMKSTSAASASADLVARLAGRSNAISNILNKFSQLSLNPPAPYSAIDLGKSLLKDAAKSTAMHYARQPEIEAWTDFFWKDKTASLFFEIYQKAYEEYAKSAEALEQCQAEEQRLEAFGKRDPYKFVLGEQTKFSDGQELVTTVTFDVFSLPLGSSAKEQLQEVLIGSRKARPLGDRKHSLIVRDLVETRKGEVGLVISQGRAK